MAIYALADLHGRYDLYEQICNFLKPWDEVIFLGDACDRGPDSWKLVKSIYENPQFTYYLKGNHEDMFIKAATDIEHYGQYDLNYMLSVQNGGEQNIVDWEREINRSGWIHRLNCLPTHYEYVNKDGILILLSHAGYTPIWDEYKETIIFPCERLLLWDRKHYQLEAPPWDNVNFKNTIVVHGHTPIPLLREEREKLYDCKPESLGAYWYCDNHKVCIDNGSVWTDIACLLDLNSFDEHIFYI